MSIIERPNLPFVTNTEWRDYLMAVESLDAEQRRAEEAWINSLPPDSLPGGNQ